MSTPRKVAQVAELQDLLREATATIGTRYQGMSVAEQGTLRAQLSEIGLEMRVVKNTLLRIAAAELGQEQFADLIDGPTALVVSRDDAVAAAKAVTNYKQQHEASAFDFGNAVIDGLLVDAAYIKELATVPPREELLARIAGGLVGKLIELMGLLAATTRDFAGLIEARATQLEAADA